MSYPQDCLIVRPLFQIDSSQGDARGTYEVSRKIGQKNVNIEQGYSICSFTHAVPKADWLRVLDVLRLAAEKGILWSGDEDVEPSCVSKEEFEWQVFLGTTYEDVTHLPLPQKLSEEFKQFDCTSAKIQKYFVDHGMYSRYRLAFDVKNSSGEKLLQFLKQNGQWKDFGVVFADWDQSGYGYEDELKSFQQFEKQLFSLLE